jgi:hypothetical protein
MRLTGREEESDWEKLEEASERLVLGLLTFLSKLLAGAGMMRESLGQ